MKHTTAWLWLLAFALLVAATAPLTVHAAGDAGTPAKKHKADAG